MHRSKEYRDKLKLAWLDTAIHCWRRTDGSTVNVYYILGGWPCVYSICQILIYNAQGSWYDHNIHIIIGLIVNGVYLLEYWKLRNSSHTFFAVCKINLQFINIFSPYKVYNGKSQPGNLIKIRDTHHISPCRNCKRTSLRAVLPAWIIR